MYTMYALQAVYTLVDTFYNVYSVCIDYFDALDEYQATSTEYKLQRAQVLQIHGTYIWDKHCG